MEITFLGTSSMVPTKERNVTGIYLKYKAEGILLDCGEGTQRQMNIAGIKRTSVTKILVSHWHGDHVSGIIGLLQTVGNETEPPKIMIYGPRETKKRVDHMMQTCIFDNRVDLEVFDLEPKCGEVLRFFEDEDYALECARLNHGIPCIGFSFVEKKRLNIDVAKQKNLGLKDGPWLRKIKAGKEADYKGKTIKPEDITYAVPQKKLTYIADTEPCEEAGLLAQGADIMISESTFASNLQDKADLRKHMSAKDAALTASQAEAGKLVLTHFSQRYKTVDELEEEAKIHFPNTVCAFDFMKLKL
ncbi:MAG: ribonuclease Z [Candidatus Woesearchaeota archaeon]